MRKSKKIIAAFAGITGTVVLTVGFVSHAAETCICICVITKQLVPVRYWHLRDDDC